ASATDVFARAHEIALQAGSGTLTASDRGTFAVEVSQLKEQLVALANQKGSNGYLFGGTKTDAPPFGSSGAFSGGDDDRGAAMGPTLSVTVSVSGAKAFTAAGGQDVFAQLDALEAALSANDPTAIGATVTSLDTSRRQILAARVDAGMKLSRLDVADAA